MKIYDSRESKGVKQGFKNIKNGQKLEAFFVKNLLTVSKPKETDTINTCNIGNDINNKEGKNNNRKSKKSPR